MKRRGWQLIVLLLFLLTLAFSCVPGLRDLPTTLLRSGSADEGTLLRAVRKVFTGYADTLALGGLRLGVWLSLLVGVFQVAVVGWIAGGVILLILAKRVWQPRAVDEDGGVALEVVVPKDVDADANRMVGLLRQLRSSIRLAGLRSVTRFSLEAVFSRGKVRFVVWCPRQIEGAVRTVLKGTFPKIRVLERDVLRDTLGDLAQGQVAVWQDWELMNAPYYPTRMGKEFEGEPLDSLIEALEPAQDELGIGLTALCLVCRSVPGSWKREGIAYVAGMEAAQADGQGRSVRPVLSPDQRRQNEAIRSKLAEDGFDVAVRVVAAGSDRSACGRKVWNIGRALALYNSDAGGSRQGFAQKRSAMWVIGERNPLKSRPASGEEPPAAAETSGGNGAPPVLSKADRQNVRVLARRSLPPYFGMVLPFGIGQRRCSVLTPGELGWLWYPPGQKVQSNLVERAGSKYLRPPDAALLRAEDMVVGPEGVNPQGRRLFLGQEEDGPRYVGLGRLADVTYHLWGVGPTGSGKTELQKALMQQWLRVGPAAGGPLGLVFIDAKGPATAEVALLVPLERERDVMWFDPQDDWIIPFNPMDHRFIAALGPQTVARSALEILERAVGGWQASAVGLEEVLRMTFLAAAYGMSRPTFPKAFSLIDDDPDGENAFREEVLPTVRDRHWDVAKYFDTSYRTNTVRQSAEAARRRFRMVVTSDNVRHLIAVEESVLDFSRLMDEGKILLARISPDLQEDQATIGSLIFQGLVAAGRARFQALQRDPSLKDRLRVLLAIIDEFQMFAGLAGLDEMVSQMRQARVGAGFFHQFVSQLGERELRAIFGNVGTKIVFPLSDDADARRVAAQSGGVLGKDDFLAADRLYKPYVSVRGQGWYGVHATMPLPLPAEEGAERRHVQEHAEPFVWPAERERDALDEEMMRLMGRHWNEAALAMADMEADRFETLVDRINGWRRARALHLEKNPGLIPDKVERVKEKSRCRYGTWRAVIQARMIRSRATTVSAPADDLGAAPWWEG